MRKRGVFDMHRALGLRLPIVLALLAPACGSAEDLGTPSVQPMNGLSGAGGLYSVELRVGEPVPAEVGFDGLHTNPRAELTLTLTVSTDLTTFSSLAETGLTFSAPATATTVTASGLSPLHLLVSGTPTADGILALDVSVSDGQESTGALLMVFISPSTPNEPPAIAPLSGATGTPPSYVYNATQGQSVSDDIRFEAQDGDGDFLTFVFELDPAQSTFADLSSSGLTFPGAVTATTSTVTGPAPLPVEISGTPTAQGTLVLDMRVDDGVDVATATLRVVIAPPNINEPPILTPRTGVTGSAPDYAFAASVGVPIPDGIGFDAVDSDGDEVYFVYTIAEESTFSLLRDAGLTFPGGGDAATATVSGLGSVSAVITGTPSAAGTLILDIVVGDGWNPAVLATLTVTIDAPP